VVPPEHYFALGDHRNPSNDSRDWGFVPEQDIFGEAVFRYWPLSKPGLIRSETANNRQLTTDI